MARLLASDLLPLLRHDGEWLRCASTGCDAYWGQFRSWTFLRVKLADHRARKHAGRPLAAGNRPQRRAAGIPAQGAQAPAGLLAIVDAFVDAHVGGAAMLGRGVARKGYEFGPTHVLKIAHHGEESHNLAEYAAYQAAPDWAKPHLAPAVAVHPQGRWLLVVRAARVGEATWGECQSVTDALRGKVRDLHPGNIGWLNGRWVATDYAGGMQARAPW